MEDARSQVCDEGVGATAHGDRAAAHTDELEFSAPEPWRAVACDTGGELELGLADLEAGRAVDDAGGRALVGALAAAEAAARPGRRAADETGGPMVERVMAPRRCGRLEIDEPTPVYVGASNPSGIKVVAAVNRTAVAVIVAYRRRVVGRARCRVE